MQTKVKNCPVCNHPLTCGNDGVEHITVSEWEYCTAETPSHYVFEFQAGSYMTSIFEKKWHWSYNDDWETVRKPQEKEINEAINAERKKRDLPPFTLPY